MIGDKIEYTIDNFSGLIDIEEYKEYEDNNNKHHTTDKRRKKSWIDLRSSGVYIFYNDNKEIVYIGKTINCLKQRIHYHIVNSINQYVINTGDYEENFRLYKRNKYKYMSYIKVDKGDTHFVESYLINKNNPLFNKEFNSRFKYPEEFIEKMSVFNERRLNLLQEVYNSL
tara:strand:- start:211 stop:720 length:510 start_codon:yes stop_codon:yes gene_type:complete